MLKRIHILLAMLTIAPVANAQKIYWTDSWRIHRADLDGSNVEFLLAIEGVGGGGPLTPRGIALDLTARKMYLTASEPRRLGRIVRANLDGSNVESLIFGLNHPQDIFLDLAAGKMYWNEITGIFRANLGGSDVEALDLKGLERPAGIALDEVAEKIYWTDVPALGTPSIRRADLDGSNVEYLITTGLVVPVGIALDLTANQMYWTDQSAKKIQRADLDGSNVEDLVTTGLEAPNGIALDLTAGHIYWVDRRGLKIQRANLDGSNVQDLITHLNVPHWIALDLRPSAGEIRFLWLEPQGLTSAPYPPGTTGVGTPDLKLGGVPAGGQILWLGVFISNWGPQHELAGWFARLDSSTLPEGLSVIRPGCGNDQDCFDLLGLGLGSQCGPPPLPVAYCVSAFQQIGRADFERFDVCACTVTTDDLACGCEIGPSELPHADPGSERNGATFVLFADETLEVGPHTIGFLGAQMQAPGGIDLGVKVMPATFTIRSGSCCFNIGVVSTTPCASDVTFTECQDLNIGPFQPVFRDGEVCPYEGGTPCPLALGACCNSQAGPLAEVGRCENLVQFLDCQCPTCTWFQDESCDDIIEDGLCEADFVAIPTVSAWGLVIATLLLLIGSKIVWHRRTTKV